MRRSRLVGLAGVALLFVVSRAAPAQEEAPERLDPAASCLAGGCHTKFGEYRHPHWKDFAAECRKCHVGEGDAHEFEVEEEPDLCAECHDPVDAGKVLHEAIEDGCADCHDPHGSAVRGLLTEKDEKTLCLGCHEEDPFTQKYQHDPVAEGGCTDCHNPHSAPNKKLLLASGSALCAECHDDVVESIEESDFVHDPAEEDCTDCHSPHSGPFPRMLAAQGHELCAECHEDVVEEAQEATVAHGPVLEGDECVSCHSPHAGVAAPNLKAPQVELCVGCHDHPVEAGETTLTDMKDWMARNRSWHEPINEEGCSACHAPHGGENFRMLKKRFPKRFYSPFEVANYELCFSCHEPPLVTAEKTRSATGFRDGDQNLHFLHVNRKKGRTCRACHDFHASSNSRLVRETVAFGKWMMPIGFRQSEDGGSCKPGCHASRSYDRNKK